MKEYHLTKHFQYLFVGMQSLQRVILFGLFSGFVTLYPIYVSRSFHGISDFYCCFGLLFLFLLLGIPNTFISWYVTGKVQLVISEKGVAYNHLTGIEASWPNIKKISKRWQGLLRVECLIVNNADVQSGNGYPVWYSFLPGATEIPISCFAENWRESELGQQIKQYAPHLFLAVASPTDL